MRQLGRNMSNTELNISQQLEAAQLIIAEQKFETARDAIVKNPDLAKAKNRRGSGLLNSAARAGHEELFQLVVSLGAVVNLESKHEMDILQYSRCGERRGWSICNRLWIGCKPRSHRFRGRR